MNSRARVNPRQSGCAKAASLEELAQGAELLAQLLDDLRHGHLAHAAQLRLDAQAGNEAVLCSLRLRQRLAELNSVGQLELDLARVSVTRAQAELATHQALIEKCTIKAPFPGRVAEQKVREQQFVQPGQALLDILDDTSLELEFLVPSSWLRWVKPGQALRVTIDETRKTYAARFTRIGAKVDPVSQSIKVAATIDGSPAELVAGMSGRVVAAPQ